MNDLTISDDELASALENCRATVERLNQEALAQQALRPLAVDEFPDSVPFLDYVQLRNKNMKPVRETSGFTRTV